MKYLRLLLAFFGLILLTDLGPAVARRVKADVSLLEELPAQKARFRVMSWNVENLYDTIPDAVADDREFLPNAPRKWNTYRYWAKQGALARTILVAGGLQPVDIIGLCEVEGDSVLYDLCRRTRLARLGYEYVITQSRDLRGIDVGLLYQPESFALFHHRSHSVPRVFDSERPTRDILLASGRVPNGDTLDVMVVHFPSRRGGADLTDAYRVRAAEVVRQLADSLQQSRQRPQLLVMGDFNDEPKNRSISEVLAPSFAALSAQATPYPAEENATIKGTYCFRGDWSRIDHILVSHSLLETSAPLATSPNGCRIFALPYLLEKGPRGEKQPRRTYLGTRYHYGVSDHLPLLLDLWY